MSWEVLFIAQEAFLKTRPDNIIDQRPRPMNVKDSCFEVVGVSAQPD